MAQISDFVTVDSVVMDFDFGSGIGIDSPPEATVADSVSRGISQERRAPSGPKLASGSLPKNQFSRSKSEAIS